MIAVAASCLVVVAAATLTGLGVSRLAGLSPRSPYGPGLGFAALITASALAVKLPGRAVTALVAVALLAAAGAIFGRRQLHLPPPDVWAVAVGAFVVACIPFVSNERVGLLGVAFNNDLSEHLPWMEALRSESVERVQALPTGYPLGPHSLVVAVAELTGVRLDEAVTGFLMAIAVLTAVALLAAVRDLPIARRIGISVLAASAYLLAAYYSQGSFKETAFALLLLTLVLILADVAAAARMQGGILLAVGVLAAATLYTFSYFGLVWLAATLAAWAFAEAAARGMLRDRARLTQAARPLLRPAIAGTALVLLLLAPELPRLVDLFREAGLSPAGEGAIEKNNLGNLAHALSPFQSLGIWRQDDFRFDPATLSEWAGAAVAVAAVAYGLIWFLRRRLLAVPAAAAVCWLIYAYSDRTESPYVSAKPLVIVAPLMMVIALRALFDRQPSRASLRSLPAAAVSVLALVFAGAAAASTYLTLRGGQVGADDEPSELRSLRPIVVGAPTLFLGMNDYYRYLLIGTPLGHGYLQSSIPTPPRGEKRWEYGKPFDFDTPSPEYLDRFTYVIEPRSSYRSETPANFHLVRSTQSFRLWRRTGRTDIRSVLPEGEAPGAVMNCAGSARRLSKRRGIARIRRPPVVAGPIKALQEGESTLVEIRLPAGTWNLDLQYTSARKLDVTWPGGRATMIPRQGRPGPFWHLGTVRVAKFTPLPVTIKHDKPLIYSRTQVAYPTLLAATPQPEGLHTVSLKQACGQYVDWYKTRP